MVVIRSLKRAVGTLLDSPIIFVGGILYAAVVAPQILVNLVPGIGPILSFPLQVVTFFVTPFIIAGIVGMAAVGLGGSPDTDTFLQTGKQRYLPLLLGRLIDLGILLLFGAVTIVLGFLTFLVSIFVIGSGELAAGGPTELLGTLGGAGLLVLGLTLLALAGLYIVVRFFIQLYPVAIAADDHGPIDGFTRSVSLVRSNLVSVLGFSLVNLGIGLLASLPAFIPLLLELALGGGVPPSTAPGAQTAVSPGGASTSWAASELLVNAAIMLISLVTAAFLRPFRLTYMTAFYGGIADTAD